MSSLPDDPERTQRVIGNLDDYGLLDWVLEQCRRGSVPVDMAMGRRKDAHVIRVRHRIWAVTRWTLAMSYPSMGAIFEVDHTTVMVAVRKYEDDLQRKFIGAPLRAATSTIPKLLPYDRDAAE